MAVMNEDEPMADADADPPLQYHGKGKGKRAAPDTPLRPSTLPTTHPLHPSKPQILHRAHHRKPNPAASVWGPQDTTASSSTSTRRPPFNIYKAILRHPNLFFQFALRLSPFLLTELYAIDKEFHYRLNHFSISIVAEHARYHAPDAAFIFSWSLFPDLCISDPMLRPMDGRPHLARDAPSLRWAKMVLYRDGIVRGILTDLATEGLRVEAGAKRALMKFWLLMETPRRAGRANFLADRGVWGDKDLCAFLHLLVKLDMRFSHPVYGNGCCALSQLMLGQKSLTPLYCLLKEKVTMDCAEVEDMVVRTYPVDYLDLDTHPWLADEVDNWVPRKERGLLCCEEWDPEGELLEPAVEMLGMEAVRRKLGVQRKLLGWVTYGFTEKAMSGTENVRALLMRRDGGVRDGHRWPQVEEANAWVEEVEARLASGDGDGESSGQEESEHEDDEGNKYVPKVGEITLEELLADIYNRRRDQDREDDGDDEDMEHGEDYEMEDADGEDMEDEPMDSP